MAREMVLRQQVYEQIKHEIITGALQPGEPLSEAQFLGRFEVSKTPVREALTSLVQDRLVEYQPNRGFSVTSISIKDIQEIFDARIFFETELFRLAVRKVTDAEIDELERLSRAPGPDSTASFEDFLQANLQFHLALAAAARNTRLVWYYTNLMNEAQRLFYVDISQNLQSLNWGHGHDGIIQALRNRDEDAGVELIRVTLENARKRMLGG